MNEIVAAPNFDNTSTQELAQGVAALAQLTAAVIKDKDQRKPLTYSDRSDYVLATHAHELAKRVLAEFPVQSFEEVV